MHPTNRLNYIIFDGKYAGGAPVTTGREDCGELHAFFPAGGGFRGEINALDELDEMKIGEVPL